MEHEQSLQHQFNTNRETARNLNPTFRPILLLEQSYDELWVAPVRVPYPQLHETPRAGPLPCVQ